MLGKDQNSHGLVLGISGGALGESFCLRPCKCLSQEPGCLFLQEACCLNAGGTQGQSFSGNPRVSGLIDNDSDVKPHTRFSTFQGQKEQGISWRHLDTYILYISAAFC